jgi:hypothetical protein
VGKWAVYFCPLSHSHYCYYFCRKEFVPKKSTPEALSIQIPNPLLTPFGGTHQCGYDWYIWGGY